MVVSIIETFGLCRNLRICVEKKTESGFNFARIPTHVKRIFRMVLFKICHRRKIRIVDVNKLLCACNYVHLLLFGCVESKTSKKSAPY